MSSVFGLFVRHRFLFSISTNNDAASLADLSDDDYGVVLAILSYAVRHNISGFTPTGLKLPEILQSWSDETPLPDSRQVAVEVAVFQEQLTERIAMLSGNRRMLEEIWHFNEISRQCREDAVLTPDVGRDVLNRTVDLLNALVAGDAGAAVKALTCVHRHRFDGESETPQIEAVLA